jgi:chitinase
MVKSLFLLLASSLAISPLRAGPLSKQSSQVIAYIFPQSGVLQPEQIDARAVTRINYAFANIQDGLMVLGHPNDAANLAVLAGLRKENPSLTILISVGGWLWSGQFSDVALTQQSRSKFIQSVVEFINLYRLDGLDIDWEYPGMPGAGHPFRSEDRENFTKLLKELRAQFNREKSGTGRKLLLTIAAGAGDDYLAHTEMAEAQKYLDTVNLMAYDYYEPSSGPITGHHAPLFPNPIDPQKVSAASSASAFERAGVPAHKLVLGVPFYGHMWGDVPDSNHGLYQSGKSIPNAYAPFSLIESSMLNQGFTRYWDSTSSVPYLYNPEKRVFVSYEDEESLAAKCKYVLEQKLGGIMFWSYFNDSDGKLLKTIDSKLLKRNSQPAVQK